MPDHREFQAFLRRARAQLDALESGLAKEYDKMADSDVASAMNDLFSPEVAIWDKRKSKAAKAEHIAAWLASNGPSETAEMLVALRTIVADKDYARKIYSASTTATQPKAEKETSGH